MGDLIKTRRGPKGNRMWLRGFGQIPVGDVDGPGTSIRKRKANTLGVFRGDARRGRRWLLGRSPWEDRGEGKANALGSDAHGMQ